MEQQTKIPAQATINLLKAIHYFAAGQFFIGAVISEVQPKMNAKKFLTDLQRKANSVIVDLKLRISDANTKETLLTEISDPLEVDAIIDTYLFLNLENRANFAEIGSFILDSQMAAQKRKEQGYSEYFDERIGHSLEPLHQFKKEMERHLSLINKQIEILETHSICKQ